MVAIINLHAAGWWALYVSTIPRPWSAYGPRLSFEEPGSAFDVSRLLDPWCRVGPEYRGDIPRMQVFGPRPCLRKLGSRPTCLRKKENKTKAH